MEDVNEHPAINFLKSLYRNCENGLINLRFLPSSKGLFIPLSSIDQIPRILKVREDQDAYFGVATRKNRDATKQGIIEIPSLWVDVDLNSVPGEEPKKPFKALSDVPLKPTFIILSGGLEGGVKVRQVAGENCDTWSIDM